MGTKNSRMMKTGAMEMSVGTLVTIVLLMLVMVMGIYLIMQIGKSAKGAIDLTDQQLKDQINKLFSNDESKKLVIYPDTETIEIKKGAEDAFGFAIRNIEPTAGVFAYSTKVQEIASDCTMTEDQADKLIILGKSGSDINILSGSKMDSAKRVTFSIPESASLCSIDYILDITKDGSSYTQAILTVKIVA